MRVITANLNGIRSAAKKGFFTWLSHQHADVICLQETKAQEHQLGEEIYCPKGFYCYYVDAQKKGYSGVAIYSRHEPQKIHYGLDWQPADDEGRYVQVDFEKLSVASLYLPSGSSGEERQQFKFKFLDFYKEVLIKQHHQTSRDYIICGDWNIAHKQIDLKNWRGNQKNSGFLPEERAWMDWLLDDLGFVDAFRVVNSLPDQYTWWSNRGDAWNKNVGWRIDYQIITPRLATTVKSAAIYKEERFSDHAPLLMDYDIKL